MSKLLDTLRLDIHVISAGIGTTDKKDLAILSFESPVHIVGAFTNNKVVASPVRLCRHHLKQRFKRPGKLAIVVNSGCANACTGVIGDEICKNVVSHLARQLDLNVEQVFPFSTGEILKQLPEKKMLAGITKAIGSSCCSFEDFADAIMTTDKARKIVTKSLIIEDKQYNIVGIAKGSGMICPDMATMLAFVITDIPIDITDFNHLHKEICDDTFNAISVDGEMSTNDSFVGVCASFNDRENSFLINKADKHWSAIRDIYSAICDELVMKIVEDGEGATRVVELKVTQASTIKDADHVARGIANSPLVKTAIFAGDPNLGRILSAIGACTLSRFNPDKISIVINGYLAIESGTLASGYNETIARDHMSRKKIDLKVCLGVGAASRRLLFCDLSYDYVKINAEYRT